MLLTFFLVVLGWVIFRAESIGQAWDYLKGVFNVSLLTAPWLHSPTFFIKLMIALTVLLAVEWTGRMKECPITLARGGKVGRWSLYLALFIMIFLFGATSESFIYFQF